MYLKLKLPDYKYTPTGPTPGDFGIGGGATGGIRFLIGRGSDSLMSTTTASDVRNVLATDVACSKQHLTTFVGSIIPAAIKSSYMSVAALYPYLTSVFDKT